jgi:desumoylating isopeptidase 1
LNLIKCDQFGPNFKFEKSLVGRILHDKSLKSEARVKLLHVMAVAALKDDVILMLHQDRREHVLMNFAQDIDRITPEEQLALTLFVSLAELKNDSIGR